MLRQNRYKDCDFIQTPQELVLYRNVFIVSEKHDIELTLEPSYEMENLDELRDELIRIVRAIPMMDNEVQDYDEYVHHAIDFPFALAGIYVEKKGVALDYWAEEVNSQIGMFFAYENGVWVLKDWNGTIVSHTWNSKISGNDCINT